jgi:hypothetical protein
MVLTEMMAVDIYMDKSCDSVAGRVFKMRMFLRGEFWAEVNEENEDQGEMRRRGRLEQEVATGAKGRPDN